MAISSKTVGYHICSECGKVRTKDPTGVCCSCRQKMENRRITCKICGKHKTNHKSGVCAACRRARTADTLERMGPQMKSEYIDSVIQGLWADVSLLTYYQQGKTFDEIAILLHRSKTNVYQTFRRLVGAGLFDTAVTPVLRESSDKSFEESQ